MSLPDFAPFDCIAHPVFVLTEAADGTLVYAFLNAAGRAYFGAELDEIRGKSARDLFSGRASATVYRRQREAWDSAGPFDYEIALPIADDIIWVQTHLTPGFDAAGHMTHMVGVSTDITAHKQLEQAQAMTAALTQEMEDFVSFAAHDLRSPIANVRMLADVLRDGFVDLGDGKLEMIDMIETISERALDLVTDVLSHSVAAQADVRRTQFNFGALCDDILVTLDPTRAHDVTVTCAHLEADYTALHIILRNLIDNAFKHAQRDAITMQISVLQHSTDTLRMTVCDDGAGFPDPALAFLSGGETSAESGFGLLGVRRLVRARGGTIAAVPPVSGRGAQVQVTLPGMVRACVAQDVGAFAI